MGNVTVSVLSRLISFPYLVTPGLALWPVLCPTQALPHPLMSLPPHTTPLPSDSNPERMLKRQRDRQGRGRARRRSVWTALLWVRAPVGLLAIKPVPAGAPHPEPPASAPTPIPSGRSASLGCREGWPIPSWGRIYLYERRPSPNKAKGCVIIFQKAVLFLRLHLLCISLLD